MPLSNTELNLAAYTRSKYSTPLPHSKSPSFLESKGGLVPSAVELQSHGRVEVTGGVIGDLVRLLPACELGCGNKAMMQFA